MSEVPARSPSGAPAARVDAVILAGGFGTRIQHLAADVPKPMIPVLGRPFLEWLVRSVASQGVRRIVLSTGHLAEIVERHFQSSPVADVSVQCVREVAPLGTAGGFLNAIRVAGGEPDAWLVLNGDSMVRCSLAPLLSPLAQPEIDGGLLGLSVADASRYGTLIVGTEGELRGFREKQPGAGVVSAGVYWFRPRLLGAFPNQTPLSFETDVFPTLTARNARLKVCLTDAPFLDIGTPETLPQAEQFLREQDGSLLRL